MISLLYVDDEPALLEICKIFLELNTDIRVDTELSSEEALNRIRGGHYDAVVSDYQMPVLDGIELLKKIRSEGMTIPFILFTGKGREQVVIDALNSGADFYLQKGGDVKAQFSELVHHVRQAVHRRKIEHALQQSQERQRLLFKGLPIPTFTFQFIDSCFVLANYNEAAEGIAIGSIVPEAGIRDDEFFSAIPAIPSAIRQCYTGRKTIRFEARTGSSEEEDRIILSLTIGFVPPDTVILHADDITQKKRAEEAREHSERRLADIINFLPDATFAVDRNGFLIAWNRAMEEMSGVPSQDVIGRGDFEYAIPFYGFRRPMLIDQLFRNEGSISKKFYSYVRRSGRALIAETTISDLRGKRAHLWMKATPLYDSGGEIAGAIESMRDITETRQNADALRHRLLALTRPAGDLSSLTFSDLFDIEEIQKIQDAFSSATGVASIITDTDGNPITRPSNFCRLCDLIRSTEVGCKNCIQSDATIGRYSPDGPVLQPCLSGGLWDGGTSISVGDHHIANWLFGQVLDDEADIEGMTSYARTIGIGEEDFLAALRGVPRMPREKFRYIGDALFLIARQLSNLALQNVAQAREITLRSDAEKALAIERQQLDVTLHSMGEGVIVTDTDGRITLINSIAESLTGWTERDATGKDIGDVFSLIDRKTRKPCPVIPLNPSVQNSPDQSPGLLIGLHGRSCLIAHNASPVLNSEGIITGIVVIFRDVTLEHQQKALREESERKYRALAENINDIAYSLDKTGKITFISPQVSRFGLYPADIAGHYYSEFVVPEDLERVRTRFRTCCETGEEFTAQFRIRDPSGDIHWLEDNGIIQRDEESAVTGMFGMLREITRRKHAEDALLQEQENVRAILEHSPDGIFITNLNGIVEEVNSAAMWLMKCNRREELIGRDARDFIKPEDLERVLETMRRVIGEGKTRHIEAGAVSLHGDTFPMDMSVGLVRDSTASPFRIICTFKDITSRRAAQDALIEEREFARSIFENSPDPIVILDLSGIIIDVNTACITIGEADTKEDLVGKSIFSVIEERDHEGVVGGMHRILEGEWLHELSFTIISAKGNRYPAEISAGALRDPAGNPKGFVVTYKNISERLRTERELEELVSLQRAIIESTADGILVTDADGRVTSYNQKFLEILKIPKEVATMIDNEALFNTALERLKDPGEFVSCLKKPCDSNERPGLDLFELGDGRIIERYSQPRMISNVVAGRVWSFRDVTETRRTEEHLQVINKKLNLLSSINRHDILNKLTGVYGYLDLTRAVTTNTKVMGYLEKTESAVKSIDALVNDSRDYQELGIHNPVWLEVDTLIRNVMAHFDLQKIPLTAQVKGIEIYADPLFEKVIYNLIEDTFRHGKNATAISVSYRKEERGITLIYEDNGAGVADGMKGSIFELGVGEHTGLGLFLVREILAITGITIRETGIFGKGARFEMFIPDSNFRHKSPGN